MSDSYKKQPITKICGYGKQGKIYANRKVRQAPLNGTQRGTYKKLYCSWNIKDYVSYYSAEQAAAYYEQLTKKDPSLLTYTEQGILKKYPTLESFMINWEKSYKRK